MGRTWRKFAAAAGVLALAVAAALTAAVGAGAERPIRVTAENLDLTFNGGVEPMRISRTKLTPIAFNISGKIRTVDGSQPPALTEFVLETDPDGVVDARGFPACSSSSLQSKTTAAAKAACHDAIIGSGQTSVEITFPEQRPIPMRSPLLVVNGGMHGGVTTFYLHTYFDSPVAAAVVVPVKISWVSGRYGLKSVARIPTIAGGSGSVTGFSLEIDRKITRGGKQRSIVAARCDGVLEARGEANFADGMKIEGNVFRPCTPVD